VSPPGQRLGNLTSIKPLRLTMLRTVTSVRLPMLSSGDSVLSHGGYDRIGGG